MPLTLDRHAGWPPQVIRLFVSSTFADLDAEREVLVKDVFPRFRRLCEERGVAFSDVDLRWGIPPWRIAEGELVRTCLAEIDRCRPFFLALLAKRYGTATTVPPSTLKDHPWLAAHVSSSITEIEIRHGALNNPGEAEYAIFYLREDEPEPGARRLREEIVAEPRLAHRVRRFKSPQELRDIVYQSLEAILDEIYPRAPADNRESEERLHAAFARSRSQRRLGRGAELRLLESKLAAGVRKIVVSGAPGMGKSTLLAAWLRRHLRRNPGARVVFHFAGASPFSTHVPSMLRRVITELMFQCDVSGPIPEIPTAADLASWLQSAAVRRPVTILLDGIDTLDVPDNQSALHWLPDEIPEGIRLLISLTMGSQLAELARRGWETFELSPLRSAVVAKVVRRLHRSYGKEMEHEHVERIVATPATATPRFLEMLLEELRVTGDPARLEQILINCLAAPDAAELFRVLLLRCEKDSHPGLVRKAMGALWVSRQGISEHDLMRLVGTGVDPIPAALWSPFFLAVEHALWYRRGRLMLGSAEHREAVRREYVASSQDEFEHRHRFVWFISNHGDHGLNVRELVWQLELLRDWANLAAVLGRASTFESIWRSEPWEVRRIWARLERETSLRAVRVYGPALADPGLFGSVECIWYLSALLSDLGSTTAALALRSWLVGHYHHVGDKANEIVSLGHVAFLQRRLGRLDEALQTLNNAEELCDQSGDEARLMEIVVNRASVQMDLGDADSALATYRDLERRFPLPSVSPTALRAFHNGIGLAHMARGDLDAALQAFEEAARLGHDAGDLAVVQAAVGNLATVHLTKGSFDETLHLLAEQERICRRIGHQEGLVGALGNRGLVLLKQGRLSEAVAAHTEELAIAQSIRFTYGQKQGLGHLAQALLAAGAAGAAADRYEELAKLNASLGDLAGRRWGHHNATAALQRYGLKLRATGDHEGARDAFRRMLANAIDLGEEPAIDSARMRLVEELQETATTAFALGRHREALDQFREQEELSRARGDEPMQQAALRNQATMARAWGEACYDQGDLRTKLAIAREHERIFRALADDGMAEASLRNVGILLEHLLADFSESENFPAALAAASEARDIYRRLGDASRERRIAEGELWVLSSQACAQLEDGDFSAARELSEKAVTLAVTLKDDAQIRGASANLRAVLRRFEEDCRSREDWEAALECVESSLPLHDALNDAQGRAAAESRIVELRRRMESKEVDHAAP
ncbi:MAG TPA: hypothetical protein DD490_14350 [Acidobacteria bacterium]|nr:hypothetical protein [Acidobacteriota bacterium]